MVWTPHASLINGCQMLVKVITKDGVKEVDYDDTKSVASA